MYEVTDMSTNKMYALKVVFKARLSRSSDKYSKVGTAFGLATASLFHKEILGDL